MITRLKESKSKSNQKSSRYIAGTTNSLHILDEAYADFVKKQLIKLKFVGVERREEKNTEHRTEPQ